MRRSNGYTAWNMDQGYVSIHNPSDQEKSYQIKLDRKFGLHPRAKSKAFILSSPIEGCTDGLPRHIAYGDVLNLSLKPKEIRILNFSITPRDWKRLIALQKRNVEDYSPPKPVPLEKHAVLGTWHYVHAGNPYSREFTKEGFCILREREKVVWKYFFKVQSPTKVIVNGLYPHVLREDGTMTIENRYYGIKK